MLTRVKIDGYKSLKHLDLRLADLSILFGPNAAGKSNFLDCLQLLSKLTTERTIKEAFAPPYRGKPLESFSFGEKGIEGLLEKDSLSFSIEVDVRLSNAVVDAVNRQIWEMRRSGELEADGISARTIAAVKARNLRYRIEIEMRPKSGVLRVADEYLAALTDKGEPIGKRRPFLSREGNRLHLRLEGQAHPTYYERHLDHSILSLPHYPPHYPHLVAMRKELESWLFFYFEPRERMRTSNPVKEVRHIGQMGEELASFLNTLKALDPRQFTAVEKAMRTLMPNVQGIDVDVSKLGEVELKLREHGISVPARILSEGTLRILGLLSLAGAQEQPSLIGFEEPENGIHPRRIQLVAELLKTRASFGETQYIVTTHSPLLPDLVEEESLFACKRVDGETRIEPFAAWGALAKRGDVDQALMDENEDELTVSERMLRGDFDA
ncbi:AAA family ATPase [Accumulibacter sp.]|uniref:AAA family ATPase n=1 Tax=Accumulibacter sp. TaxID=2053492 RepID=UPI0025D8812A|nr:AAA family ATPase [Accumulibacter sp.]MCM8634503.1 AAA family ATPase [Accumulibacter sp.]MCM8641668.1 AAA family ATPase [Accumulibacter sp.]